MPHGNFKPRNQHGHNIMMSKRSERHDDKAGNNQKRARQREQNEFEIQQELDEFYAGHDEGWDG